MTSEQINELVSDGIAKLDAAKLVACEATFKQDIDDYPPAVIEVCGDKRTIGDCWDAEICSSDYDNIERLEALAWLINNGRTLLTTLRDQNAKLAALRDRWREEADAIQKVLGVASIEVQRMRRSADELDLILKGG